jgi:hypothetical protein
MVQRCTTEIENQKKPNAHKKMDNVNSKIQNDFAFDFKRTIRRITKDSSPICTIDRTELKEFWVNRWSNEATFERKDLEDFYHVKEFRNEEMNNSMIADLIDTCEMV